MRPPYCVALRSTTTSPTVIQGKTRDLWVRARIEDRGDYLSVTGDLVNLRPAEDRAVLLCLGAT